MSTSIINGIDVSDAQGDIDYTALSAAGFRFCVVKATEGADYQSKRWVSNMEAIAQLDAGTNFFAGAYHFGRPDNRSGQSGGETEGKWFCKVLKQTAASVGFSLTENFIEPVLDMEKYNEDGATENNAWIQGFLNVVQQETGRKGMIYTGPNYWRYQQGNTDQFAQAGIPLWEVSYSSHGSDPSATPPRMPTEPSKPEWAATLWQWSGGGDFNHYGTVPGVPGGVADVDRVMGDESVLLTLAAATGTGSNGSGSGGTQPGGSTPQWSTLPENDLRNLRGQHSSFTARVQGLLLSQDYGPHGLVSSSTGRPDGISGDGTESALSSFKSKVGLPADTMVDQETWWQLVQHGLD